MTLRMYTVKFQTIGLGMVFGHCRHRVHGNVFKKQSRFGQQVRRLALKSLKSKPAA